MSYELAQPHLQTVRLLGIVTTDDTSVGVPSWQLEGGKGPAAEYRNPGNREYAGTGALRANRC